MPVGQAVSAMALQAAFNDPRFPPLPAAELGQVEIAVSLLSPLRRVGEHGSDANLPEKIAAFVKPIAEAIRAA